MSEREHQFYVYLILSGLVAYCALITWALQIRLHGQTKRHYALALVLTANAITMVILTATAGENPFFPFSQAIRWIVDSRQAQIVMYTILALQLTAKLCYVFIGYVPRWLQALTFVGPNDV